MLTARRVQCSWGSRFTPTEEAPPEGQSENRLPEFVNISHHSATAGNPTWSHTVPTGLTDAVLIVAVGHSGTGANSHFPTAVTYDGEAMDLIELGGEFAQALNDGSNGTPRFQRWYMLLDPPEGTASVLVTMNTGSGANFALESMVWQYVDQADPVVDIAVAQANTGTSITASVTGTTPTDRILAAAVVRNVIPVLDGTLTYHDNWSSGTSTYIEVASKSGGGNQAASFSWSATNPPNNNTLVVVALRGGTYETDEEPPPPSGDYDVSIPAAEGGGTFTRVYHEDFPVNVAEGQFLNHSQYVNKWTAYGTNAYMTNQNPANGGNGNHYGGNTNLSVVNNELIMRCYRSSSTGKAVGCAPSPKINGSVYFKYGRITVTFRCLENTPGWKVAWLLWNQLVDNNTMTWPPGGEFDFNEGSVNSNIGAFHHWYNATNGGQQDAWESHIPYGTGYHTITMEWTPHYVRVVVDGTEIGRRNSSTPNGGTSRIVDDFMRCVLQTETNLGGTQPATPGTMRIAIPEIAVWQWAA